MKKLVSIMLAVSVLFVGSFEKVQVNQVNQVSKLEPVKRFESPINKLQPITTPVAPKLT